METNHRNIIQRNHVKLSQRVDLDLLYPVLLKKQVIFRDDLDRLKAKYVTRDEQAGEFFLRYTKRGPEAFHILIDSLIETGHISEAKLLQDDVNGVCYDSRRNSNGGVEPLHSSVSQASNSNPSSQNVSPKLSARYTPELTMEELPPLILQIQNAQIYNNGMSADECYSMMSKPRGFALIINNLEFNSDPSATRYGAEQDSHNLGTVLQLLHFEVTIRHNVLKEALLTENGIIDTFLAQFKNTEVDCCIVAVMSHGTEGYFLTSDAERLNDTSANRVSISREFLPRFNNHYEPLQNKPKIFIIQACRGYSRDRGIGIQRTVADSKDQNPGSENNSEESSPISCRSSKSEASSSSELERLPSFEDFLICQSTVPGFVANRDTEKGTWYIYTLCQELCERAHDTEFTTILKRVSRRMKRLTSEYREKQMSSFINTGFHFDLYFNPGLFKS